VKFERVGDRWTAWFNGREAGSIDGPRSRGEELRLVAENGTVRIASVVLTTFRARR
jgi:hypothetical protein